MKRKPLFGQLIKNTATYYLHVGEKAKQMSFFFHHVQYLKEVCEASEGVEVHSLGHFFLGLQNDAGITVIGLFTLRNP